MFTGELQADTDNRCVGFWMVCFVGTLVCGHVCTPVRVHVYCVHERACICLCAIGLHVQNIFTVYVYNIFECTHARSMSQ